METADQDISSQRVLSRSKMPLFYTGLGTRRPVGLYSHIRLEGALGVLTLVMVNDKVHFSSQHNHVGMAFIDVVLDFINNRPMEAWSSITIREVENFLRDEGSQMAYSASWSEVLSQKLINLLIFHATCLSLRTKLEGEMVSDWPNSETAFRSSVDKIKFFNRLFEHVRPHIMIELYDVKAEVIQVRTLGPQGYSNEVIEKSLLDLIEQRLDEKQLRIKIVPNNFT